MRPLLAAVAAVWWFGRAIERGLAHGILAALNAHDDCLTDL